MNSFAVSKKIIFILKHSVIQFILVNFNFSYLETSYLEQTRFYSERSF